MQRARYLPQREAAGDEGMSCLQCTMVMWVGGKGLSTPDPPHVHSSTWEEKVGKTLVSSKRQERG